MKIYIHKYRLILGLFNYSVSTVQVSSEQRRIRGEDDKER